VDQVLKLDGFEFVFIVSTMAIKMVIILPVASITVEKNFPELIKVKNKLLEHSSIKETK